MGIYCSDEIRSVRSSVWITPIGVKILPVGWLNQFTKIVNGGNIFCILLLTIRVLIGLLMIWLHWDIVWISSSRWDCRLSCPVDFPFASADMPEVALADSLVHMDSVVPLVASVDSFAIGCSVVFRKIGFDSVG